VEQIPHLNRLAEQFRDSKVLFLSLTDEDAGKVKSFTAKRPIAGWIGLDLGRTTHDAFGVQPIPRTFLIDAEGVLRGITMPGRVGEGEIRQLLAGKNVSGADGSSTPVPVIDLVAGPQPLTLMLIRPTEGNTGQRRPGPGSYQRSGVSLRDVLAAANNVPSNRVIGPDWLDDQAWDVAFSVPPAIASAMWPLARQTLSATFQIQDHREDREIDVFVMRVVEGRTPRLRPSSPEQKQANWNTKGSRTSQSASGSGWTLSMFGRAVLDKIYGEPVLNETGMEGRFDFEMTMAGRSPEAYTAALRDQLGLDVQKARRRVPHIVIDRAVRPAVPAKQ
jgi:uncharacterized protein (TIGR03435 family)